MAGVCEALAVMISTKLPAVTGAINIRKGFVNKALVPVPRAIFIDARARLQVDEHPAVMIVPQRSLSLQRIGACALVDGYKCTYEVHVYCTTDTVESQERAAIQRQWLLTAMRECLLLYPDIGSTSGEIVVDETTITEVFGPVLGNFYAEGYVGMRVNTVEELSAVIPPSGLTPFDAIVIVDLNMSIPYVP